MMGPYGCLITKAVHEKHIYKEYIGCDACAVNLLRLAMYGAYHHITVMGKEEEPCIYKYDITGSLCENNDKFAVDRMMWCSLSATVRRFKAGSGRGIGVCQMPRSLFAYGKLLDRAYCLI